MGVGVGFGAVEGCGAGAPDGLGPPEPAGEAFGANPQMAQLKRPYVCEPALAAHWL